MHDYTNTTVVVTGASKGLGEAYARELASRGAHLILVARSADALHTLAGQIRKAHSVRVDVIAADLSDRRSPQTVADAIEELGLDVDLLHRGTRRGVRNTGVRVMAAHPGATDTGFFDRTTASMDPKTTDTPAGVAARTLDDFACGRSISFPGRTSNRAGTWASRLLPRTTIARITGNLNRKSGFDDMSDLEPATS